MPRPKDQAARRKQLIQATLEAIASLGLARVTVKSIADRAGISPRLVPYYYPDLDALIEAAHQAASERYYWSRQRALEDDADPPTKLARLMHSGLPREGDRLLSQVLNEMSVNAGRSPMHSTLMTLLYDREVSLYQTVLDAGSASGDFSISEPTVVVARSFVALEDALGLHLLGDNSSMTVDRAEQQLASYARLTTGVDVTPRDHAPTSR